MADAVAAEKRAQDVVDKYRKRMDTWSASTGPDSVAEHDAIISELKADIAAAINAVTNEFHVKTEAVKDAKAKAAEPEAPRPRPATTHMPATGTHGRK